MQTEVKSTRRVTPQRLRCDFRFSCELQSHFACTLQHSVSDRIGLLQSAPGPKLMTILNGLVPRLVRNEQNTVGTLWKIQICSAVTVSVRIEFLKLSTTIQFLCDGISEW